jgi:hypothetical protein
LTEFKQLEETVESFFVFGKIPSSSLLSRDSMPESTHHTRSISPEDTTRQMNHQPQQTHHRSSSSHHHPSGHLKGFPSSFAPPISSISSSFSLGSFSASAPQSTYGQTTQVRKL